MTLNVPLNVVVDYFIRYATAVKMELYVFQKFWRNQYLDIFQSVVPKIQL